MEKKTSTKFFCMLLCLAVVGVMEVGGDDSLAGKCASEFQKVTQCLPYVTAKAEKPTKDCCDSATAIKENNPACLCYIIEQIHNGSNAAIKSMGVQESRLLQLPSACNLANASVSDCPKLLKLPPNSPDAAIFTNVSSTATPVATPGAGASTSTTPAGNAHWHKPQLAGCITFATMIFFYAFPTGLMPS